MMRNTLIEHKKTTEVCEESGLVSLSYNVLLTTLEPNVIVKPIIPTIIAKSTLTCTNCGKTNHLVETYHNRIKKVQVVPIATVKSTEHVTRTKTQHVKSRKIHVCYPCIICSNIEHRFGECPRKIEVHNMFKTKPISSNATTTPKPPKTDNVLVNVVVVVTIRNQ
jgi:hypothetical protein